MKKRKINLPVSRLWWFLQSKYKLLAYVTPLSPHTGPPYISGLSKIVQSWYNAILSSKVSASPIFPHIPIAAKFLVFFLQVVSYLFRIFSEKIIHQRVRLVNEIRKLNWTRNIWWNSSYQKREEEDNEKCSAQLKATLCCECSFDRWRIRGDYPARAPAPAFFSSRLDILLCIPLDIIIWEIRYRIRVTARQR